MVAEEQEIDFEMMDGCKRLTQMSTDAANCMLFLTKSITLTILAICDDEPLWILVATNIFRMSSCKLIVTRRPLSSLLCWGSCSVFARSKEWWLLMTDEWRLVLWDTVLCTLYCVKNPNSDAIPCYAYGVRYLGRSIPKIVQKCTQYCKHSIWRYSRRCNRKHKYCRQWK